jgi:hypothetical protein
VSALGDKPVVFGKEAAKRIVSAVKRIEAMPYPRGVRIPQRAVISGQNSQLAVTSSVITARSGSTAGKGTVFLVNDDYDSGTTNVTLTTTTTTQTVFSYSSTTGGIASGIYVWIAQGAKGNWFVISVDCGN